MLIKVVATGSRRERQTKINKNNFILIFKIEESPPQFIRKNYGKPKTR